MKKKPDVSNFIKSLLANSHDYHKGTLHHDEFTTKQYALWDQIEEAGAETKKLVLDELRNLEK